ncbi:hypothetical protein M885DRAFT_568552 [Pelagophyceae sp. CCMP2097]|nr:hypothetical protein M885DRAFT_568552 [Pelagophyceae sp. CCMP2097]
MSKNTGVGPSLKGQAPYATDAQRNAQSDPTINSYKDKEGAASLADAQAAYLFGREQRLKQLSRNRAATSIFASEPPREKEARTMFGKLPKAQTMGRTASADVGKTATEGMAQYLENAQLAHRNKFSKDSGSPLSWGDAGAKVAPIAVSREVGATATEGMTQYVENKAAARRNKTSKDSGSPLSWAGAASLSKAIPSSTEVGATATEGMAQ